MARNLGVAGIQMRVDKGEDNTTGMLKKLKSVVALFPWVDVIFFSELCLSGMDLNLAMPIPNSSLDKFIDWARKEKNCGRISEISKGNFPSTRMTSAAENFLSHWGRLNFIRKFRTNDVS